MIDVCKLLYELCDDKAVLNPDCELLESGILDSLAFIELFSKLEDLGNEVFPSRISREVLKTPKSIQDYLNSIKNK